MATYVLPDVVKGGIQQVQGNSLAEAQQNAANASGISLAQQQAGGSYGTNSLVASSGGGGGGSGNQQDLKAISSQLDAQYQKMLAALASGNKEAFEFEKQKFNQQFAEAKREFDLGFQANLLNTASSIRGPRDYLQYQNYTRGGRNLVDQLTGNQAIPQFGAPSGTLESANIGTVLQDLGLLPGGAAAGAAPSATAAAPAAATGRTYGPYNVDAVVQALQAQGGFDPNVFWQLMNNTANPSSLNYAIQSATGDRVQDVGSLGPSVLTGAVAPQTPAATDPQSAILAKFGLQPGQTLNPTQINPANYDAIGQVGQSLTKNLAETYLGYDPTDFENMINAQRPQGTAPKLTTYTRRAPSGIF